MDRNDPRNIFFNQRRDYDENGKTEKSDEKQKAQPNGQNTAGQTYEEKVAEMKKLAEKYQREGEGQLVKDIVNNVIEQKAAGKLSNEQLVAFAKRISPMLNAEQRSRLNGLLEQLLKV